MEHYTALHWTLTMWKYSFVASNCPGHHPAGAGAGVAVTFSWQLLACSWYLHILRCPDTGTGLDLAGWSPLLHTGKRGGKRFHNIGVLVLLTKPLSSLMWTLHSSQYFIWICVTWTCQDCSSNQIKLSHLNLIGCSGATELFKLNCSNAAAIIWKQVASFYEYMAHI